jgi:hypothetical protein
MENMGINQLAQMFLGNPQPLQQKVDKAQQQAKPGQIPPDLEEAMALQKIQEMRNAAQNQQAMQAGGPQPTVVQQLKQAVAPQPQAAPQGMPQGMPQGGPQAQQPMPQQARPGLPQLPSELGQHLAGGGIIAFAGEEGSYVDERDILRRMEAGYDPAVTEKLNSTNARHAAMPAEALAAARERMAKAVLTTPEQEEKDRLARYERMVPERDTSVYDRAASELERRKKQFDAPQTGMPALMEWLQQVAVAPKGVGSLTAGAMGAQKTAEMQKEREQQQFDLTKQILEQQQKKLDVIRGDAEKKFGVGNEAYNAMFKHNFEAAKQITQNDFEAEKLAKQMTDNQLNRESEERRAKERNENALKVANAPGQTERIAARIEKLRAQGTPEAEAQIKQILDTHAQITGSGAAGVGSQRNRIMELRLDLETNKELLKNAENDEDRKEALANIKSLQAQINEANKPQVTPLQLPPDVTEATLKDGQIYQTGRGNARWNAKTKTFTPVN